MGWGGTHVWTWEEGQLLEKCLLFCCLGFLFLILGNEDDQMDT